jgi:hypothetical protein
VLAQTAQSAGVEGRISAYVDQLLIQGKGGVHHIWGCDHYKTTLIFSGSNGYRCWLLPAPRLAVRGTTSARISHPQRMTASSTIEPFGRTTPNGNLPTRCCRWKNPNERPD